MACAVTSIGRSAAVVEKRVLGLSDTGAKRPGEGGTGHEDPKS